MIKLHKGHAEFYSTGWGHQALFCESLIVLSCKKKFLKNAQINNSKKLGNVQRHPEQRY